MSIHITSAHQGEIRQHAEAAFPFECCGFLLGRTEGNGRRIVHRLRPAVNEREDAAQHHRFLITAENFQEAERSARCEEIEIVGFYHSHPDAEARPSVYDAENAWPWYSYVIVSVKDGTSVKMTSWVLRDDRSCFDEESIDCTK